MDDTIPRTANARLAELLGWTGVFAAGAALMGTPPDGAAGSRGQAMVPDWCGDWRAAGPLLGQFGLCVAALSRGAVVGGEYRCHAGAKDRDATIRHLIVLAVTARLEARARRMGGTEVEI